MKKYIVGTCLFILLLLPLAVGFSARANAFDPFRPNNGNQQDATVCDQTDADNNQSSVCKADGSTNPLTGDNGLITKAANIFAVITGVAAVIAIIIGGFEYVRSSGDSSKVNKAKNTILFAVIGLVVVVVARSVVALVIGKL